MMNVLRYFKLEYLLLPLIIYVSDDTVIFGTNIDLKYIYFKYVFTICAFFLLFAKNKTIVKTRQFNYCVAMCFMVVLSSVFNDDLRLGLVYKCVVMLLSCAYASKIGINRFTKIFVGFMYVVAFVSVMCTLMLMVHPAIFSFAMGLENTANTPFYNLFIYVAPTVTDSVRNYGIFREPGVYQMYLIISLVLMLYYTPKFELKKFVVVSMALFLTFSTTGYIAYVGVAALLVIKRKGKGMSQKQRRTVLTLLALCVLLLVTQTDLLSSEGMVFDKFSNSGRHTTIARMSSLTTNVKIWLQYPIFGAGLQNVNDMFETITLRDYGFASPHNTNTFLCELATFGIFYFILFCTGIVRFSRLFGYSLLEHTLFFALLFVLSIGEKLTFSPFFYIMIFYGYRYNTALKIIGNNTNIQK